jgi:hypothetical protein
MAFLSWLSAASEVPNNGLRFINPSRAYSKSKRCVSFWGYDGALEVSFHLEEDALDGASTHLAHDETSLLRAFDLDRFRIEKLARSIHARAAARYHWLTAQQLAPVQL